MKTAVIGLGHAGRLHVDSLATLDHHEIAAVCDPSAAAREKALAMGIPAYSSFDKMLDETDLDAVTIAAPPGDHADMSIAALHHGLHVLCEKPLALTTRDAVAMLRTANGLGRHLLLATKFRHVPEIARAREILASGEIGEAITFEIRFSSSVAMGDRWNSRRHLSGGGVLIDNGSHAFDLVSYLFGRIRRVQAMLLKPIQSLEVEDSATVMVQARDGIVGRIELSWSLQTGQDAYLTIHGSKGSIEIGWQNSRYRKGQGEWEPIGSRYDKIDAHARMHDAFAGSIAAPPEATPWITPVECLLTVAAVESAYRSVRTGGWERVETERIRREPAPAAAESATG